MAGIKYDFDELVTLKFYVENKMTDGYTACSENIHSDGILKIDSVDAQWWIKNNDINGGMGRSFASHPNEHVYIIRNKK